MKLGKMFLLALLYFFPFPTMQCNSGQTPVYTAAWKEYMQEKIHKLAAQN